MSAVVRARSRLFSAISRNCNRKFSSTVTTEPPKEPIVASSNIINDQAPNTPPPPPPSPGAGKKFRGFLKYGLLAAVTGGIATAGYATYGSFLFRSNFYSLFNISINIFRLILYGHDRIGLLSVRRGRVFCLFNLVSGENLDYVEW